MGGGVSGFTGGVEIMGLGGVGYAGMVGAGGGDMAAYNCGGGGMVPADQDVDQIIF